MTTSLDPSSAVRAKAFSNSLNINLKAPESSSASPVLQKHGSSELTIMNSEFWPLLSFATLTREESLSTAYNNKSFERLYLSS
jgi:hypothetical protein